MHCVLAPGPRDTQLLLRLQYAIGSIVRRADPQDRSFHSKAIVAGCKPHELTRVSVDVTFI